MQMKCLARAECKCQKMVGGPGIAQAPDDKSGQQRWRSTGIGRYPGQMSGEVSWRADYFDLDAARFQPEFLNQVQTIKSGWQCMKCHAGYEAKTDEGKTRTPAGSMDMVIWSSIISWWGKWPSSFYDLEIGDGKDSLFKPKPTSLKILWI